MAHRFFSGWVALVTGASAGIGRATALALAREGATLGLVARRLEPLVALGREIERTAAGVGMRGRPHPLAIPADVRDPNQAAQAVASTMERFGRLDLLVNSAGVPAVGALAEVPAATAEQALATNVLGTLYCIQAALPAMRRQGGGRIVNLASVAGLVPTPGMSIYSASKYAVVGLSEALQAELRGAGERGIAVSVVCPSYVAGRFLDDELAAGPLVGYDRSAIVAAEEVAQAILHAARTGAGRVVVAPLGVRLGLRLARLLPAAAVPIMARLYAQALTRMGNRQ